MSSLISEIVIPTQPQFYSVIVKSRWLMLTAILIQRRILRFDKIHQTILMIDPLMLKIRPFAGFIVYGLEKLNFAAIINNDSKYILYG